MNNERRSWAGLFGTPPIHPALFLLAKLTLLGVVLLPLVQLAGGSNGVRPLFVDSRPALKRVSRSKTDAASEHGIQSSNPAPPRLTCRPRHPTRSTNGLRICPGRNEIESVNRPVVVGGALAMPGDVVVGDGDGVIVVSRPRVEGGRIRPQNSGGRQKRSPRLV